MVLALISFLLYEWAWRTVIDRHFYTGLGGEFPAAVCESGPYKFLRHPFYLSYMVAFLSAAAAFPSLVTAAVSTLGSALAEDYESYRQRVGMFLPRFGNWRSRRCRIALISVLCLPNQRRNNASPNIIRSGIPNTNPRRNSFEPKSMGDFPYLGSSIRRNESAVRVRPFFQATKVVMKVTKAITALRTAALGSPAKRAADAGRAERAKPSAHGELRFHLVVL